MVQFNDFIIVTCVNGNSISVTTRANNNVFLKLWFVFLKVILFCQPVNAVNNVVGVISDF